MQGDSGPVGGTRSDRSAGLCLGGVADPRPAGGQPRERRTDGTLVPPLTRFNETQTHLLLNLTM